MNQGQMQMQQQTTQYRRVSSNSGLHQNTSTSNQQSHHTLSHQNLQHKNSHQSHPNPNPPMNAAGYVQQLTLTSQTNANPQSQSSSQQQLFQQTPHQHHTSHQQTHVGPSSQHVAAATRSSQSQLKQTDTYQYRQDHPNPASQAQFQPKNVNVNVQQDQQRKRNLYGQNAAPLERQSSGAVPRTNSQNSHQRYARGPGNLQQQDFAQSTQNNSHQDIPVSKGSNSSVSQQKQGHTHQKQLTKQTTGYHPHQQQSQPTTHSTFNSHNYHQYDGQQIISRTNPLNQLNSEGYQQRSSLAQQNSNLNLQKGVPKNPLGSYARLSQQASNQNGQKGITSKMLGGLQRNSVSGASFDKKESMSLVKSSSSQIVGQAEENKAFGALSRQTHQQSAVFAENRISTGGVTSDLRPKSKSKSKSTAHTLQHTNPTTQTTSVSSLNPSNGAGQYMQAYQQPPRASLKIMQANPSAGTFHQDGKLVRQSASSGLQQQQNSHHNHNRLLEGVSSRLYHHQGSSQGQNNNEVTSQSNINPNQHQPTTSTSTSQIQHKHSRQEALQYHNSHNNQIHHPSAQLQHYPTTSASNENLSHQHPPFGLMHVPSTTLAYNRTQANLALKSVAKIEGAGPSNQMSLAQHNEISAIPQTKQVMSTKQLHRSKNVSLPNGSSHRATAHQKQPNNQNSRSGSSPIQQFQRVPSSNMPSQNVNGSKAGQIQINHQKQAPSFGANPSSSGLKPPLSVPLDPQKFSQKDSIDEKEFNKQQMGSVQMKIQTLTKKSASFSQDKDISTKQVKYGIKDPKMVAGLAIKHVSKVGGVSKSFLTPNNKDASSLGTTTAGSNSDSQKRQREERKSTMASGTTSATSFKHPKAPSSTKASQHSYQKGSNGVQGYLATQKQQSLTEHSDTQKTQKSRNGQIRAISSQKELVHQGKIVHGIQKNQQSDTLKDNRTSSQNRSSKHQNQSSNQAGSTKYAYHKISSKYGQQSQHQSQILKSLQVTGSAQNASTSSSTANSVDKIGNTSSINSTSFQMRSNSQSYPLKHHISSQAIHQGAGTSKVQEKQTGKELVTKQTHSQHNHLGLSKAQTLDASRNFVGNRGVSNSLVGRKASEPVLNQRDHGLQGGYINAHRQMSHTRSQEQTEGVVRGTQSSQNATNQQEQSRADPPNLPNSGKSSSNEAALRKARSESRTQEVQQREKYSKKQNPNQHQASKSLSTISSNGQAPPQHPSSQNAQNQGKQHHQQRQRALSQKRVTDRPQSASAGQRFIGRSDTNLKDLFAKNWQNVNVTNKVDPQSGESTTIKSLTVVDIDKMMAEIVQESSKLQLAPGTRIIIPNHEPTKCSNKRNGIVRAYAANTNQGLVRNYNEDRVSIILNIVKPEHRKHETWPTCSFFGVYDGHGGSACAEFLRDNLHHFVIREESFPWKPEMAIREGFAKAESKFLEKCQARDQVTGQLSIVERSGSCAIVVLIVDDICYTANVGDSRAVLSSNAGQQMTALSRDHKPSDVDEYRRIIQAGGQIYQTTTAQVQPSSNQNGQSQQTSSQNQSEESGATAPSESQQKDKENSNQEFVVGPIRVLPGRLSVCRTFGDPEAKLEWRGGNPNVVQAVPDIRSFQIGRQHDFIALASDGIFDKLSDEDLGLAVWLSCESAKQTRAAQISRLQSKDTTAQQDQNVAENGQQNSQSTDQQINPISVHQFCGLGVEGILKNSLMRQSLDNVTVVMVAFQNFKRKVCDIQTPASPSQNNQTSTDGAATKKPTKQINHSQKQTSIESGAPPRPQVQSIQQSEIGSQERPVQEKENNINFLNKREGNTENGKIYPHPKQTSQINPNQEVRSRSIQHQHQQMSTVWDQVHQQRAGDNRNKHMGKLVHNPIQSAPTSKQETQPAFSSKNQQNPSDIHQPSFKLDLKQVNSTKHRGGNQSQSDLDLQSQQARNVPKPKTVTSKTGGPERLNQFEYQRRSHQVAAFDQATKSIGSLNLLGQQSQKATRESQNVQNNNQTQAQSANSSQLQHTRDKVQQNQFVHHQSSYNGVARTDHNPQMRQQVRPTMGISQSQSTFQTIKSAHQNQIQA